MPDRKIISRLLTTEYIGGVLCCIESVDSTNDYLKKHAPGLPDGTVVLADIQTNGKGRHGNVWFSEKDCSLAMSILLKPLDIVNAPPLTLVCGLAVARALNAHCGGGFLIKWPNDIVYGGKKICGILCEAKIDKPYSLAVCGIGVNLSQSREQFEANGLPYASSVKLCTGISLLPEEAAAAILNEFEKILTEGFGNHIGEYRSLCAAIGRQVSAITKGGAVCGTGTDITPDGRLVIDTGGGLVALNASEVSIRGIMGYV